MAKPKKLRSFLEEVIISLRLGPATSSRGMTILIRLSRLDLGEGEFSRRLGWLLIIRRKMSSRVVKNVS